MRPEEQDLAKAIYETQRELAKEDPGNRITKAQLAFLGKFAHPYTYAKHPEDDSEAMASLIRRAHDGAVHYDAFWSAVATELILPQHQLAYGLAALWAHQGFPQIVMGHKYAAALLSTKISQDVVDLVKPPWRAFFIEVPHGLLFAHDTLLDRESTITGVLVGTIDHVPTGEKRWNYIALSETKVNLWQHGTSTLQLLQGGGNEKNIWEDVPFVEDMGTLDQRTNTMIGRLIVGTCLAMSDPDNVKPPKEPKAKKGAHNKREHAEPQLRTYVLGKTPNIDCREYVTNYLRSGRTAAPTNVQIMVTGHWRNVPHGPQRALRRVQWIEPHWRGPDDAPILVKPHALKEKA